MRLGYAASSDAPARLAVASAEAAEEAGFHEVWFSEDYCERGAFAVAGAAAARTERIGIGIGVVNPWTRHPVLTAMEAAGLDELADGRLVLGMGASNERWMTAWLGIPFDRPVTRTREAVDAVRDLLAGKAVRREVAGYAVDAALSIRPPRPDVPIYLGVKGRRALAVAGECADGVLLSVMSSPGYTRWAREQLGSSSRAVAVYAVFACADDGASVRDRVRPTVAKYLGIHGDHDITRVAGLDPDLCLELRRRLLRGEPAAALVTDQILDAVAIAGTPDQCVEAMARYREAGADTLVLVGDPAATPQETVAAGLLARRAGLLSP